MASRKRKRESRFERERREARERRDELERRQAEQRGNALGLRPGWSGLGKEAESILDSWSALGRKPARRR
jgi:hypothetical protein